MPGSSMRSMLRRRRNVWHGRPSAPGENVLVVAPTGSGKTLCAFLSAIDRLMTKEGDDLLRTPAVGTARLNPIAMPRNVNPSAASRSCIFRH